MARHTVRAALLGQVLAGIIAATAVFSTSLARQGLSAPTLQSSLNYLLLGAVYTALHVRACGWRWRCPWWAYALLALIDVEANFCLVLAYRYTSMTSVTLLDCFTIPMVLLLSTALLAAAYRGGHYAGAGICVAGLALLVATDRSSTGGSGGDSGGGGGGYRGSSNPLLGDGLVLLGATLYAVCNVLQEWLLGEVPVHELLGTMGLFGCLWSALQGLPVELATLRGATWSAATLAPFLGFGLAMFAFYSLVPYELKWGGAALLNISLLASDLWTALARYFFFGGFQGNSLLFFLLSLLIVAAGIGLFTSTGDVETQLGAGSSSGGGGGDGGLPVRYHPVAGSSSGGGGGGGGGGASCHQHHKQAQEALEEMQRQSRQQQEQQQERGQAGAGGAAALPNPFDIAVGLRGGGGIARHAPAGFMPLAAAEEPWTPSGGGEGEHAPAMAPLQPASPLSVEQPQAALGREPSR